MWQDILNIIISNGIFAILFVSLLFIQIKDSKRREEKYQDAIDLQIKDYPELNQKI